MSLSVKTQGGAGGMTASIFVTGLSETDIVTATKDGKIKTGKWITKEATTQVPVMTSNTTPSGITSAKSVLTTYYPYQAFDGNGVSYTTSAQGDAQGWWVAYNFGFPVTVDSFDFAPVGPGSTGYWNRFPATVSLQGSNDGDVWNTIQDFETNNPGGNTAPPQTKTFTVSNPQTYSQYRLFWKTLTSDNDGYAGCSTIQFYGTTLGTVFGHLISPIYDKGTWTVTATDGEKTIAQDVLVDGAFEYEIEMLFGIYTEFDEKEADWVEEGGAFNYGNGLYLNHGASIGTVENSRILTIPLGLSDNFVIEFSSNIATTTNAGMGTIDLRAFNDSGERIVLVRRSDGWGYAQTQSLSAHTGGGSVSAFVEATGYDNVTLKCKYVCSGGSFEFYVNDALVGSGVATTGNLAKIQICFTGYTGYTQAAMRINYLSVKRG